MCILETITCSRVNVRESQHCRWTGRDFSDPLVLQALLLTVLVSLGLSCRELHGASEGKLNLQRDQ